MRKMTEKALQEAFAGESMAHMRYLMFQEAAEKAGFLNIARLFKAVSYAEQVHATNHGRHLGILRETEGNLETCIQGETYELVPRRRTVRSVTFPATNSGSFRGR
jgi:rubrerythrin